MTILIPHPRMGKSGLVPGTILGLYADDDEFNSPAHDQQDLAPDAEIQSNISSEEDLKFHNSY